MQQCCSLQCGSLRSSARSWRSGHRKARAVASRSCGAGTQSGPVGPASSALASCRSVRSGGEGAPAPVSRRRSARLRNITSSASRGPGPARVSSAGGRHRSPRVGSRLPCAAGATCAVDGFAGFLGFVPSLALCSVCYDFGVSLLCLCKNV